MLNYSDPPLYSSFVSRHFIWHFTLSDFRVFHSVPFGIFALEVKKSGAFYSFEPSDFPFTFEIPLLKSCSFNGNS